jgi:hypothetical protein
MQLVPSRYDFFGRARLFIVLIGGLKLIIAAIYVLSHAVWIPPKETVVLPFTLVTVDSWGRAAIVSREDLDWHVGATKAVPLLAVLEERNKLSDGLRRDWSRDWNALLRLTGSALPENFFADACKTEMSPYSIAANLAQIRRTLSIGTLGSEGVARIENLSSLSRQISDLRAEQISTRDQLRTPDRYVIFWMTPGLVLVEVVFWSLFGILTSLLFHAGKYLYQDKSKDAVAEAWSPKEGWINFTKICYTPTITSVLILALWAGILEIGGPETRVWQIPLLAFLLGFNARKSAELIDATSHWVLDRARAALGRTDEARIQARDQAYAAYTPFLKPTNLNELRDQAHAVARTALLQEVENLERRA